MSDENKSKEDLESLIVDVLENISKEYSEMNSKLDSLLIRIKEKKEKKEPKEVL